MSQQRALIFNLFRGYLWRRRKRKMWILSEWYCQRRATLTDLLKCFFIVLKLIISKRRLLNSGAISLLYACSGGSCNFFYSLLCFSFSKLRLLVAGILKPSHNSKLVSTAVVLLYLFFSYFSFLHCLIWDHIRPWLKKHIFTPFHFTFAF